MLLLDSAEQARRSVPGRLRSATRGAVLAGYLTVVVDQPPDAGLPTELTAGIPTIAPDARLRLPAGARRGRRPAAGHRQPGRPPARDAREIADQLGDAVDCIVDGGLAHGGPASTVVDCTVDPVRILRVGAISEEAVAAHPTDGRSPRAPDGSGLARDPRRDGWHALPMTDGRRLEDSTPRGWSRQLPKGGCS